LINREPSDVPDPWRSLARRLEHEPSSQLDVWEVLAKRSDPSSWRPRLAENVEVVLLDWARTGPSALAARNSVVLGLGADEAELIRLMDGKRSVVDLLASRLEESDSLEPASVVRLVTVLRLAGFLVDAPVDVDVALERALDQRQPWRVVLSRVARTLSVEWSGADRLVRWIYRHGLRWLINPWGATASAVIAIAGVIALGLVVSSHSFHLSTQSAGWGFVLLMTLNLTIVFIHELGHATSVVHHGRSIRSAGLRIYYGAPAFFVDAPEALLLSRRHRIAQAFAGPWFESVAGGVAALVLWLSPTGWAAPVLYRFVVVNYFILLMNLVPLLELDGYLILADTIGVPDLRARSVSFVRRGFWQKLARRQSLTSAEVGLGIYAIVGLVFAALCLLGSFFFWQRTFGGVASRMWHSGALGVVLLFVLAAVLASPLLQAGVRVLLGFARRGRMLWRRARFRLQSRWRVEAAKTIDGLTVFDDLPVEALNDLAGRVRLAEYSPCDTVVAQGDPADSYFVIRRGRIEVVEEAPDGATRQLNVLEAGTGFGEMALVLRSPRSASLRALEPVEVFVVDGTSFDRLLAPHLRVPDFTPSLQQAAELASMRILRGLGLEELRSLLQGAEWVLAVPQQEMVGQGELADGFYLVLDGQAEVLVDGTQTRVLRRGDHFGEIALLSGTPRSATVRALTPVRALRIDPARFESSLAKLFSESSSGPVAVGAQDRRS